MSGVSANGFSKWNKETKIQWLVDHFANDRTDIEDIVRTLNYHEDLQQILDGFSENTITNFPMPYGLAPHFIINDQEYCVPMVIEESSVVAAAAAAAKFWKTRGGFRTTLLNTRKVGQIHFKYRGDIAFLESQIPSFLRKVQEETSDFTKNMRARGGGILGIEVLPITGLSDSFQLLFEFETCDSMGANFINTILEESAKLWKLQLESQAEEIDIIMSILSNYTPTCTVKAEVSCPIEKIGTVQGVSGDVFAEKFYHAIEIARNDVYRAVTHNKGIYNGIDAVVIATGNDFRAIEAAGHAYASRDGQYRSLSTCSIEDGVFHFELTVPLALGTVGGLTKLHPLSSVSLSILHKPSAYQLMQIIAAVGLAQNFAAIRSLTTTGIQKGHMKMHLYNILSHFKASDKERYKAEAFFEDKVVSFGAVRAFLEQLR